MFCMVVNREILPGDVISYKCLKEEFNIIIGPRREETSR